MGFNLEEKRQIFAKGRKIRGKNPDLFRLDKCGNEIYWHSYGKNTAKGWQVDHSFPIAKGGTNHANNLRPLHSKENRRKGGKHPYTCLPRPKRRQSSEDKGFGLAELGLVALFALALKR